MYYLSIGGYILFCDGSTILPVDIFDPYVNSSLYRYTWRGHIIRWDPIITLFGIGDFLSKICSSFLIRRFHPSSSLVLSVFMWLLSWLLIVVSEDVYVRLAGAFVVGIVYGLMLNIVLSIVPLYEDIERNTSAYNCGDNASTFVAGFFYTGE